MTDREARADTELVRDLRDGSVEAHRRLFMRYREPIYRLAFRLTSSRHAAEDVVQDVFATLPESLDGYSEQGSFGAWLRKVASRVALDGLRRRRRRAEEPLSDHEPPGSDARADGNLELARIEDALGELSEPLRRVFVLKVVEGYGHREIAGMLDIEVGTSQVRLHRARKQLREALGGP